MSKYAIYGAHEIALATYKAYKILEPSTEIVCFMVTDLGDNAPSVRGIPVRELREIASKLSDSEKNELRVLIATQAVFMPKIEQSLDSAGIRHHERIDSDRWSELMTNVYLETGEFRSLYGEKVGKTAADVNVYMAKFWKDKKLSGTYEVPKYCMSIQVGAANTDAVVADIRDDEGDNISSRNANYSELTALYWIWKNVLPKEKQDKYVGLAHYRRFLAIGDDDLKRLAGNDIDVVLPYPLPNEPDSAAHHKRYIAENEWEAVLKALQELQPEYYEALDEVMAQEYIYAYNIFVAKNEVMNDYCGWLFPLLFRVEELIDPQGIRKPNRYIGYIAETLETLYFMHNKEKYNIVFSGFKFLL